MSGEIELLTERTLTFVVGHDSSGLAGKSAVVQVNLGATSDPATTNDTTQGYAPGSSWFNKSTGRYFICREATTNAAVWQALQVGDKQGYIVNNWLLPDGLTALAGTPAAPGVNSIRLFPGRIRERVTINSLGIRVTTLSAGGNVQAAIYANNPTTGRPTGNALASTASMSTTSTGLVNSAVSVQLEPGLYWWATNSDNGTSVLQSVVSAGMLMGMKIGSATQGNALGSGASITGLAVSQTFGTWPDLTAGSFSEQVNTASMPALVFKVASVP